MFGLSGHRHNRFTFKCCVSDPKSTVSPLWSKGWLYKKRNASTTVTWKQASFLGKTNYPNFIKHQRSKDYLIFSSVWEASRIHPHFIWGRPPDSQAFSAEVASWFMGLTKPPRWRDQEYDHLKTRRFGLFIRCRWYIYIDIYIYRIRSIL